MSSEIATNEPVDVRPIGITDKQDAIIQHVAEFVVNSCDSAKYQHKLRSMTRHNAYFNFLDPDHAYYSYYEYLLQSYRYWKEVEVAAKASGGTAAMFANMNIDNNNNNNKEDEYYSNYNANIGNYGEYDSEYGYYQSYHNMNANSKYDSYVPTSYSPDTYPAQYVEGEVLDYRTQQMTNTNYYYNQQQPQEEQEGHSFPRNYDMYNDANLSLYNSNEGDTTTNNVNSYSAYQPSGYYDANAATTAPLSTAYAQAVFTPAGETDYSVPSVNDTTTATTMYMNDNRTEQLPGNYASTPYAVDAKYNTEQVQEQQQHQQVDNNDEDEEEEDEGYEMIIENGVQKLVPRRV